ncbi:MAG: 3-oxoacyl-ACP synthase III family protein [Myxococcota bacterium]
MTELSITGLGVYLPRRSLDNAELPALDQPHTRAEMDAVGVLRRGVACDDEGVLEMAVASARAALSEARVTAAELDFIVLANWTERRYVPDFAPKIQQALGAERAFAFDVCGACCGFLYGLSLAQGYLANPRYARGLVIASDRSTRLIRPRSRGTLIFGDAAAAAVVERDAKRGIRLLDYELRTDGARSNLMEVGHDGYLVSHAKQREVNQLAVDSLCRVMRDLLARHGMSLSSIDYIVPHSGTPGIQRMLAQALDIDPRRVLTNLPIVGNVTTAAIPVAMRHFLDNGPLAPGQLLLSAAVGLGWNYAGALFSL